LRPWLVVTVLAVLVAAAALMRTDVGSRARAGLPPIPGARTPSKPANGPTPGYEESGHRLGSPSSAALASRSTSYRFTRHQADGVTPVTFSPCRPVHYVLRTGATPPGGAEAVQRAVAAVSHATGLRFVFDGRTDEPIRPEDRPPYQPARYGDRWAPVLIAFTTSADVPDFGVDIAGEAGPLGVTSPDGRTAFVTGNVFLDFAKSMQVPPPVRGAFMQSVAEHELGHLVGLAHVADEHQVMYPRVRAGLGYQPGDLAGLAQLGSGPCAPDL
jgi:hypothetical protein